MKKFLFFISALLTISFLSFSQESTNYISVKGKVFEGEQNTPLPSAHVKISGTTIGTVSNLDGEFLLKFPTSLKSKSLVISFIGYDSFETPVSKLNNDEVIVRLKPQELILNEIIVNSKKSELSIIEEAIAAIPKNHGRNAIKFSAFLRDYARQEGQPFQINEGLYDVYMGATSDKKPLKQAKMVQARFATDRAANHRNRKAFEISLSFRFNSGLSEILEKDMVNNVEESFLLSKKSLKQYDFKLKGAVEYEGNNAYLITYQPKKGIEKSLFSGKIYLDVKTLAFIRIEGNSSPELIKHKPFANKLMVMLAGMKECSYLEESFIMNYKKIGDKWYFNNSYETGKVNLVKSKNYFNEVMSFKSEYVVTDFNLDNSSPFKEEEIVSSKKLQKREYGEYNENFWKDYNIIKLDKNNRKAYELITTNNELYNSYCSKDDQNLNTRKKGIITPKKLKMLDEVFSSVNNEKSPGLAVGIIQDDDWAYKKGFGMADIENGKKITPNSVFQIASVSKQFTAMAILLLEEKGKLSLNDDIRKYLPELPEYVEKITIKDLTLHTSGLKDVFTHNLLSQYVQNKKWEDFTNQLVSHELIEHGNKLDFIPGEKYQHSNTDYALLALIIEKVSQQSVSQFAKENIFDPLGMKNTYFGNDKKENIALGYRLTNNLSANFDKGSLSSISKTKDPTKKMFSRYSWNHNAFGQDGVSTTLEDMYLWDQNFYKNKLGEGEDELIHKMQRVTSQVKAGMEFGFGTEITKHRCQEVHISGGGGPVFSTEIWRFPDLELTIICMSNADIPFLNTAKKVKLIADILLEGK